MSNLGGTGNLGSWQPVRPGDKGELFRTGLAGQPYGQDVAPHDLSFDPGNTTNGDQTGGKMPGGAGQNYGSLFGESQQQAQWFNANAQRYNQTAPQIGDVSQLSDLSAYYENALSGKGPSAAQAQLQSGIDQSVANQMSMAASARGGAAAMAGAQRAAQQGAGTTIANGAAQAAALRAQEMQGAASGLQGVGTIEEQRLAANANLQQQNQQQINAMQTALYGLGAQESGLSLSEEQAYMANLLAAEGIQTQQSQFNTQLGVQLGGAALNAAGGAIGAGMTSDEYAKEDVEPQGLSMSTLPPEPAHAFTPPPASPTQLADQTNNAGQVGASAGTAGAVGAAKGAMSGGVIGALLGGGVAAGQAGLSSATASHPGDQTLHTVGGAVDPSSLTAANAQKHPNDFGAKAANVGVSTAEGAGVGALGGAAAGGVGAAAGAIGGGIAGFIKGLMSDEDRKHFVRPASVATLPYHLEPV